MKCFCFIYKEQVLRRSLLKDKWGTSPPTTNSIKAKPRKKVIGGAQELQTPALTGATSSPPTHNVSTPGDPSGQGKRVYTQVRVVPGWVG